MTNTSDTKQTDLNNTSLWVAFTMHRSWSDCSNGRKLQCTCMSDFQSLLLVCHSYRKFSNFAIIFEPTLATIGTIMIQYCIIKSICQIRWDQGECSLMYHCKLLQFRLWPTLLQIAQDVSICRTVTRIRILFSMITDGHSSKNSYQHNSHVNKYIYPHNIKKNIDKLMLYSKYSNLVLSSIFSVGLNKK